MSGPLPSANTLKLLTPATSVWPATATSAIPSAAGKVPGTPGAGEVQKSKPPEQSAKLIIIDGVGPSADGLVNNPAVAPALGSPGTADLATAAYMVLHGPAAIDTMFPNVPICVDAPVKLKKATSGKRSPSASAAFTILPPVN